jgi:hypothetical protein
VTIADTIRAALDAAGIRHMPVIQNGDGWVEVYVSSIHGAETFSTVGAAINAAGLRARPMVPAYGWFVRCEDAP